MDLQSLLSLGGRTDSTLSQAGSGKTSQTADSLAKLSPALAKARDRVVAQEQSTATSLSTLGKYKAALAALGSSAGTLSQLNASSSPAAIQSALDAFVADYNAAVTTARQSFSQGSNLGTSTMLSDLRRLLSQRTSPPTLRTLGVTAQADGTLKVDPAALKTALATAGAGLTSAFAQLGKAAGKLADAGLSGSSRLSSMLTSLDSRMAALKKQETALLNAATKLATDKQSGNDPVTKAQQQLQQAYLGNQGSVSIGL